MDGPDNPSRVKRGLGIGRLAGRAYVRQLPPMMLVAMSCTVSEEKDPAKEAAVTRYICSLIYED